MDKDHAARDYELKKLTEAQQHAQDLEKLKQDENDKLQALADAYALKVKQDEEQRTKDLADAQKNSDRQMEDLDTATNNKLKKLADGWVAEYNLDATAAQQIYDMLIWIFWPKWGGRCFIQISIGRNQCNESSRRNGIRQAQFLGNREHQREPIHLILPMDMQPELQLHPAIFLVLQLEHHSKPIPTNLLWQFKSP